MAATALPADPQSTDWSLVLLTGAALTVTVTAFLLALRHAGRASGR